MNSNSNCIGCSMKMMLPQHKVQSNYSSATSSLSTTTTTTTPRTTSSPSSVVSFAPTVVVHYHLSRVDYSVQEIDATWYNKHEYNDIAKRCNREICRIENGERLHDKKYCSLGLERRTQAKSKERLFTRYMTISAVLEEQDKQQLQQLLQEYDDCEDDGSSSSCGFFMIDEYAIANVYQEAIRKTTTSRYHQHQHRQSQLMAAPVVHGKATKCHRRRRDPYLTARCCV